MGIAAVGCIDAPTTSESAAASTVVGDYVGGSCSTAVVIGLSKQIADEIACEHGNALVPFGTADSPNITLTSNAVLPYLEADAKADLLRVAQDKALDVNSTFRTIAQQYLLYHWYLQGRCGISAAATVGHSNHESGRAIDLANWSDVVGAMSARGWAHDVPGDYVHFDHTGSSDIRGEDVHAFQVLWNMNNPNDTIAEDGAYGPHTEARLVSSPATGFTTGPSCATTTHSHAANIVSVDGPDQVQQLSRATYNVVLANIGDTDWPATATIALASGATSPLYDASWQSSATIATLGSDIPAGAQATLAIAVSTPAVGSDTPFALLLALSDGATAIDNFSIALTVVPNQQQPTSGDGNDETGYTTGGCDAGGGDGWLVVFAALFMVGRTARRTR